MPPCSKLTCRPPTLTLASDTVPAGKRRLSAPNRPCARLVKMMATPMVAIIGAK